MNAVSVKATFTLNEFFVVVVESELCSRLTEFFFFGLCFFGFRKSGCTD